METTRLVRTNGIELFVREQGSGPLVILCHGFPELSYSWRHQIPALAEAGYHVIAPDMRGYGESDRPHSIEAYNIFELVGDIVGLVKAMGQDRATVIGHDWGAPVAWHAALFRPDLFHAVAGLSVPPPVRAKGRPLELMRAMGISNYYIQYFQNEGVAEAELEADVTRTMRAVLGGEFGSRGSAEYIEEGGGFLGKAPGKASSNLPDWMPAHVLETFIDTFRTTGFRGGLNWYRNIDRNWDMTAPWQDAKIMQPALFIAGTEDAVVKGIMGGKRITEMERTVPNLTRKLLIEGAGHWIQQERPDEVNAALIGFLDHVHR